VREKGQRQFWRSAGRDVAPQQHPPRLEVPNPKHPQGEKGVGEVQPVFLMAAVADAIRHALGKRFRVA
jgi:CO/xanthine dehydrogenase Mo-binding subunit